jgi:hypothetical protein
MSQKVTKGRTIGLQLPLDLDAHVRERARLAGMSPGLWITHRLNHALRVERDVNRQVGPGQGLPIIRHDPNCGLGAGHSGPCNSALRVDL